MNDELPEKIMVKFDALRSKTYSFLIDDRSENQRAKSTKQYVMQRERKFEDYQNCTKVNRLDNKINYLENNETEVDNLKNYYQK